MKDSLYRGLQNHIPTFMLPTKITLIETSSEYRGTTEVRFCPNLQPTDQDELLLLVAPGFLDAESQAIAILSHEIFHSAVWKSGLIVPDWLEEGLALLLQGEFSPRSVRSVIQEHLVNSPHQKLDFEASEIITKASAFSYSAYGHALLFVRFLQRQVNGSIIRSLLQSAWSGDTVGVDSLRRLFSRSLEDLFLNFSISKFVNQFNYQQPLSLEFQPHVVAEGLRTKRDYLESCPEGKLVSCLLRKPVSLQLHGRESLTAFQIDSNGEVIRCPSIDSCSPALGKIYLLFVRSQF